MCCWISASDARAGFCSDSFCASTALTSHNNEALLTINLWIKPVLNAIFMVAYSPYRFGIWRLFMLVQSACLCQYSYATDSSLLARQSEGIWAFSSRLLS